MRPVPLCAMTSFDSGWPKTTCPLLAFCTRGVPPFSGAQCRAHGAIAFYKKTKTPPLKVFIVLILSHMPTHEVLFTIWQGAQLAIPLKTTLVKVKTILGADYTLAMLCSIMYAPCCQTLICSTAGDSKLDRSAVKFISETFRRSDKQKYVLIRIDIQQY